MNNIKYYTELKFTETYKKYYNEHPAIREAMCLKAEYADYFEEIREKDLFAGRIKHGKVGFSVDEWGPTAFGYYCQFEEIEKDLADNNLSTEEKAQIIDMLNFWRNEDTSEKIRKAYPPLMAKYLFSDDWMNTSGIAFPLYRLTGGTPNFKKLLTLGIPGLYAEIEKYKQKAISHSDDVKFYDGIKLALGVLVDVCIYYQKQAEEKAINENDLNRKKELNEMADVLYTITITKPKTFREAIQLFWLYTLVADVRNYGRMDVYLGDFLVNDIKTGIISEDKALELLQSLWQLMADRHTIVHNRVIIGGKGRPNEENADKFAMLALEATRTVKEIEPQLSLRIYKGMNQKVYEKHLMLLEKV